MDESYPLREIVQREYVAPKYCRAGTGTVILTLSCGHRVRRPISAEPRKAVRCEDCYFDQTQPA